MDGKSTEGGAEAPTRPAEGKHSYRRAIETGNFELLAAAFAPDAKIYVPPRVEPIVGREAIVAFLGQIVMIFAQGGEFGFTHELDDVHGNKAIVFFATVPAKDGDGPYRLTTTDLFEFDEYDRIKTMTAMTRPIQALRLLLDKYGVR